MNNSTYSSVDNENFEDFLQSCVPYKPPEDIIKAVTPWKKAMKRVIWGLALSTLLLNLFCLNYILPAIGIILSTLGLRVLRNENRWFRIYYTVTLIHAVYALYVFIINTTVTLQSLIPGVVFTAANIIFAFAKLTLFCLSLYETEKKSGIHPRKGPMIALIIWYTLLVFLGLISFSGYVLPSLMIIGFVCIIISLNKISKEIDEVGYSIESASVKISDKVLATAFVAVVVTGMACGYIFAGGYPMQWEVKKENEHAQVQQVKEHLLSLDFPEDILEDMTAEDILACENATKVVGNTSTVPFNKGRVERTVTKYPNYIYTYTETVYDIKEMTVTGIGICLTEESEGDGDWLIIHHFCWDINPGFYGTECIQIYPAYQNQHTNSFSYVAEPTGRVLYSKDGVDYVSAYHSLGSEQYTSENIVLGEKTNTEIFATFSMPDKAERQRGYVMYAVADNSEHSSVIGSTLTYNHQESFLQYPVETAKNNVKTDLFSHSPAFIKQQRGLQIADREIM